MDKRRCLAGTPDFGELSLAVVPANEDERQTRPVPSAVEGSKDQKSQIMKSSAAQAD